MWHKDGGSLVVRNLNRHTEWVAPRAEGISRKKKFSNQNSPLSDYQQVQIQKKIIIFKHVVFCERALDITTYYDFRVSQMSFLHAEQK